MEFYDVRFNLENVVSKLKKVKKPPLKLKRRKFRKSFARS